jgi:hypothetical protein
MRSQPNVSQPVLHKKRKCIFRGVSWLRKVVGACAQKAITSTPATAERILWQKITFIRQFSATSLSGKMQGIPVYP